MLVFVSLIHMHSDYPGQEKVAQPPHIQPTENVGRGFRSKVASCFNWYVHLKWLYLLHIHIWSVILIITLYEQI